MTGKTPSAGHRRLRRALLLAAIALPLGGGGPVAAQTAGASAFGVLAGRWLRPDGGYVLTIRAVGADGRLDASYANPQPLPFSRAEATLDGNTVVIFLELRAGGYNGSYYKLRYDPAQDVLEGVYYQAVAQQRFEVRFVRTRA